MIATHALSFKQIRWPNQWRVLEGQRVAHYWPTVPTRDTWWNTRQQSACGMAAADDYQYREKGKRPTTQPSCDRCKNYTIRWRLQLPPR